jgi:glycosyltransferase involved in cell wall biosynthesis
MTEINKKKLLIATDCFLPRWDGIARFLVSIIPSLVEKYDVTIIAPNYGDYSMENVNLIRFPSRKIKFGDYSPAKVSFRLIKKLVKENDILFVQTTGPIGSRVILLGKYFKKPTICYLHSLEWELFSKSMPKFRRVIKYFTKVYVRYLYNIADLLIVPYLELKEILKKHGIYKSEIAVTRLGINLNYFKPISNKEKAKKNIGIDSDKFVIGYVGRLSREKDILTLIKAFRSLRRENPTATLLVIGSGLKEYEDLLNSEKNVIFKGNQDNVLPFLQAMDVYVLSSQTETTSLSTIEAMACGIPVVVTPVGFVKNYISDKYNGLFFPVGNSLVLKLKLKLLIDDLELRKKLSNNAILTIKKRFNWENTEKRIRFILSQFGG